MELSGELKDSLNAMNLIDLIELKKEFEKECEREPMYIKYEEIWRKRQNALNYYLDNLIFNAKIKILEDIN